MASLRLLLRGAASRPTPPRERMARKTRTKEGRAAYARRKVIVEPVFGQMTILQGARHLLLRGKEAASAEWRLLCACTTSVSSTRPGAPPGRPGRPQRWSERRAR